MDRARDYTLTCKKAGSIRSLKPPFAGCSKRLRGEARESRRAEAYSLRYVGASRASATKHMSPFQQPASLVEDGLRIGLGIDEGFDHARPGQAERPSQSITEGFRSFRRSTWNSEVMRWWIHALPEINTGKRIIFPLLFYLHESEPAIVENDNRHSKAQTPGHRQLANRHLETPIAHNRRHSTVRKHKLGRVGRRHAISHGRPTIGCQESFCLIRAPLRGDLMRVRADIVGQDAVGRKFLS